MTVDADFEAHLRADGVTVDRDDVALLEAVDAHRSLNAAASALGRSYSRAHRRVTELEAALGPLVDRQRGGPGGGGSDLTGNARDLLARFARLQTALAGTARTAEVVLEGSVVERTGELATVETTAGRIRAILPEPADRAQVTIRADATTLHTPETAPPAAGTSARNRFRGTVEAVEEREAIAHVTVRLDDTDERLRVLLTRGSLERLDLEPGAAVVATFKATAARATPI